MKKIIFHYIFVKKKIDLKFIEKSIVDSVAKTPRISQAGTKHVLLIAEAHYAKTHVDT